MMQRHERTQWIGYPLSLLSAGLLLVSMSGMMAGCETTEGFGRDVEDAGDAIEDEAQEAR